jgi:spore coat polysaccharide biosynthesis protein SpsF (cytidylyltransferase family)
VRWFPQGFDCEVFTIHALRRVQKASLTFYEIEHVTPYMQKRCKIVLHKATVDRSHERLTLDTIEDYRHIYQVMLDELNTGHRAA